MGKTNQTDENEKRDTLDILAKAVAPSVYGHLDVKKGILLQLVSGIGSFFLAFID